MLDKLQNNWRKMQKYKNRKTERARNAIKEPKLDGLYDIGHQNALTMTTSEEDKEFFFF